MGPATCYKVLPSITWPVARTADVKGKAYVKFPSAFDAGVRGGCAGRGLVQWGDRLSLFPFHDPAEGFFSERLTTLADVVNGGLPIHVYHQVSATREVPKNEQTLERTTYVIAFFTSTGAVRTLTNSLT